jgi:hypothetical protein
MLLFCNPVIPSTLKTMSFIYKLLSLHLKNTSTPHTYQPQLFCSLEKTIAGNLCDAAQKRL